MSRFGVGGCCPEQRTNARGAGGNVSRVQVHVDLFAAERQRRRKLSDARASDERIVLRSAQSVEMLSRESARERKAIWTVRRPLGDPCHRLDDFRLHRFAHRTQQRIDRRDLEASRLQHAQLAFGIPRLPAPRERASQVEAILEVVVVASQQHSILARRFGVLLRLQQRRRELGADFDGVRRERLRRPRGRAASLRDHRARSDDAAEDDKTHRTKSEGPRHGHCTSRCNARICRYRPIASLLRPSSFNSRASDRSD